MTTTTILSDNGVSSGSAGIKTTGGNDGTLQLQTTTSGGAATTAVTIDTSQNVGIGTSSPDAKLTLKNPSVTGEQTVLDVHGATNSTKLFYTSVNQSTDVVNIGTGYGAPFAFVTNSTERGRFDASGNLLVGTTSTTPAQSNVTGFKVGGGQIECNGVSTQAAIFGRSDNGQVVRFYSAGSVAGNISNSGTTTSYNGTSDYRLKENIAPMTGALETVAQLKPCTYVWKNDGRADNGFIAHELQEVLPNAVTGEKDAVDENGNPEYQGIDPRMIVATLTAAIQEQQALITTLTERIAALETK